MRVKVFCTYAPLTTLSSAPAAAAPSSHRDGPSVLLAMVYIVIGVAVPVVVCVFVPRRE
jgi:heme/copper-type cytochrome/quinol oxidase subunit 2